MVEMTITEQARRIMRRADALCERDPVRDGVGRVVFTPEHIRARSRFVGWALEAGMRASVDEAGNFWFVPDGSRGVRFLLGSHLDSVPRGGRYDGALGVLLGLEVAASRCEGPDAPRDVGVVDFISEESSRFGVGTIGSSVFAGSRSLEAALAVTDAHGVAFRDVRQGLWADMPTGVSVEPDRLAGYLEVHVDQATELLDGGRPLAIIGAIAAPTRWRLTIHGQQAHAGSAPMTARRDALVAAADLIGLVNRRATEYGPRELRATVGAIDVRPNAANVVAGEVTIVVDLRVLDVGDGHRYGSLLLDDIAAVSERRGVTIDVSQLLSDVPAQMDAGIARVLRDVADAEGVPVKQMDSWSAHDALHVARMMPAGMVLVRNLGGVSHSPSEEVGIRDVDAAYRVARGAVERLLGGAG